MSGARENKAYNDEEELQNPTGADFKHNKIQANKNAGTYKALKVRKSVGILGGVSLIVGTMIGSGIFASSSPVFANAGSAGMSMLIWSFCGVLVLLISLCYVELGTMIPRSGGEYHYLREAFGNVPVFLLVFSSAVLLRPAGLAAVLLTTGNYLTEVFFPGECNDIRTKLLLSKVLAALFLGIIVFVNCASVRWATSVQVIFTATKLLAIVMLIITGFVRLGQGHNDSLKDAFNGTSKSISDIGYAFYGGLWAYDGWNNLNYVTEELKNPIRDLPLAIMIGIPLVTACYVMVNITYLTVLTSIQIASSKAVAVTLANQLYGVMAWVIPVFVACSTFGAANGSAFTSGRLVYVSAREGHMPKLLAMVHTKRHTPLPALIFTCIIAWIMLIPESSNFSTLVNYFNFAAWTFYGGTVAALLWLRIRQPDLERPYKVFIGIPIVVLLCSLYLVIAPFYDYPLQSLYCLLFILFGIPVYFLFVKYQVFPKAITTGFDKITYKIQMLCDLSMPDDFDED
ncbi:b(0,+)-type amino acid transporter 1-like isoform X5 [Hydractinia symbiolongicarpus]|uniref:b(0,+)-type amino acid transporter 1-like isoform X5 n=1 Tax=Hydractinia symbiolongicarpus TaxID=13093 RepID=UPI00254A5CA1|nr:b(0,+)-type amino acid transporter 1-like isoform X5 [Hydractinia symbiolongicarpus]